jgi:hypothetical protein
MVKVPDQDDEDYRNISGFMQIFAGEAPEKISRRWESYDNIHGQSSRNI